MGETMKLTRIIPAHRKTMELTWLKKEFVTVTPRILKIWKDTKQSSCCYWCKHRFDVGEVVALAGVKNEVNRVLCQACAKEARDA